MKLKTALLLCVFALAGCHTPPSAAPEPARHFAPANAYRANDRLPLQLRRVAVLPLTADLGEPALEAGVENLETVWRAELSKCDLFELTFVPTEKIRQWTGQRAWSAEEKLPRDFFARLHEELGCDAVLFSRLTVYRAYVPLQVGWSFKLVQTDKPQIDWAADEVFDAGQPTVAAEARS